MKTLVSCQGDRSEVRTRQLKSMDASILVVGGDGFLATLLDRIGLLSQSILEVAANPREAIQLIRAKQPELLLCQVSQPGSLELCNCIKSHSQWSWIYCLPIDDRQPDSRTGILSSLPETDKIARALEMGADSYLYMTWKNAGLAEPDEILLSQENRLIEAQIYAGLRWAENHQALMQTNDLLSAIALLDPLTELNNRRALEWEFSRQIEKARECSTPLSVLLLDVDYFKSVNDTYGHLVGDRVLQLLAERLRHNLRFYDTPFRYGGEEFAILLSNTSPDEAVFIARRLRHLIGDQPFTIDDTDLRITISAGTASLRPDDDPQGVSLLNRADQNLLRAKSQGRNRVVSCDANCF